MRMQARFWRLWLGLVVLPMGLMIGGCGGGKGAVSGKVSYQGKTVQAGTVRILSSAGGSFPGEIKEDGTYNIANVPVGKADVVVETESAKPIAGGPKLPSEAAEYLKKQAKENPGVGGPDQESKKDPKRYMPIPPEYGDVSKPKLQMTVKNGKNDFPIDLK